MLDLADLRLLYFRVAAWLQQREADPGAYLVAENRVLRTQLERQQLRLTDAQTSTSGDAGPSAGASAAANDGVVA